MEIPSSFASGVAGLQSAQSGLTQATVDVAKPTQKTIQWQRPIPLGRLKLLIKHRHWCQP